MKETWWDRPMRDKLGNCAVRGCLCVVDPKTCSMRECISRDMDEMKDCQCRTWCPDHEGRAPIPFWCRPGPTEGPRVPPAVCDCRPTCPFHGSSIVLEPFDISPAGTSEFPREERAKKQQHAKKRQKNACAVVVPWHLALIDPLVRERTKRDMLPVYWMACLPHDLLLELYQFMNSHYGTTHDLASDITCDRVRELNKISTCGRPGLGWTCHEPGKHLNSSGCYHPTVRCVGRPKNAAKLNFVPPRTDFAADDVCLPVRPAVCDLCVRGAAAVGAGT